MPVAHILIGFGSYQACKTIISLVDFIFCGCFKKDLKQFCTHEAFMNEDSGVLTAQKDFSVEQRQLNYN